MMCGRLNSEWDLGSQRNSQTYHGQLPTITLEYTNTL